MNLKALCGLEVEDLLPGTGFALWEDTKGVLHGEFRCAEGYIIYRWAHLLDAKSLTSRVCNYCANEVALVSLDEPSRPIEIRRAASYADQLCMMEWAINRFKASFKEDLVAAFSDLSYASAMDVGSILDTVLKPLVERIELARQDLMENILREARCQLDNGLLKLKKGSTGECFSQLKQALGDTPSAGRFFGKESAICSITSDPEGWVLTHLPLLKIPSTIPLEAKLILRAGQLDKKLFLIPAQLLIYLETEHLLTNPTLETPELNFIPISSFDWDDAVATAVLFSPEANGVFARVSDAYAAAKAL